MTLQLPDFSNAHILVLGDIMLDRYWAGSTSRISPEAPVPVVKIGEIENRLGGAANVAQNLATLGCKVSLCGVIGDDEAGTIVAQLLKASNIENSLVIDKQNPTITKLRIISQHQQLIRLDFEETLNSLNKNELLKAFQAKLPNISTVVLSDYAKGTITDASPFISACNKSNTQILIDPKGSNYSQYKNASLLTPNLGELEAVVGKCQDLDSILKKGEELRAKLNLNSLLVTLSEKGMALLEKGAPPLHIPTKARDVYDVTGAGDTVIATLAASIAAGAKLTDATRIANHAAGIVVGKVGTATTTKEELREAISAQSAHIQQSETKLEELLTKIESSRTKGEKIVFTNGCFDILHAGHVRYLQQAASLGDRLVVGVNSDDSISRLKGPNRPIVPLKERMEVLAALGCVDWVTPFNEDTPAKLIDAIIPDFLVKGGDYKPENIVGHQTVTTNGGEVIVMPFVDGCSTTNIIEKIHNS